MSEALDKFRFRVEKSPENLFFRFSYAQFLSDSNQFKEAIEQLDFCLSKRPDWMMASLLKAKLEIKLGRDSDAVSSLLKTIELAEVQDHDGPLKEAKDILGTLI